MLSVVCLRSIAYEAEKKSPFKNVGILDLSVEGIVYKLSVNKIDRLKVSAWLNFAEKFSLDILSQIFFLK